MPETKYLSPRNFAKLLPGISEANIRSMAKQGILPGLWSGRCVRIPVQSGLMALEQYTLSQKPKAAPIYQCVTTNNDFDRRMAKRKAKLAAAK